MDAKLRAFRKQARDENRGRTGTRRRYSRDLREAAVSHLRRRQQGGGRVSEVASELGVSGWSLSRWVRDSESRPGLVRVEVEQWEETATETLTLVTPRGYRIEGLSEDGLIRMVERLG